MGMTGRKSEKKQLLKLSQRRQYFIARTLDMEQASPTETACPLVKNEGEATWRSSYLAEAERPIATSMANNTRDLQCKDR